MGSSRHADTRCAQRSVSREHIELALDWGYEIHQPVGRVAYHMGRREAAAALKRGVEIPEDAVNIGVVVAGDGTVLTVIRTADRQRLKTFAQDHWRSS